MRLIPRFHNILLEIPVSEKLAGADEFYYRRRLLAVFGVIASLLLLTWGYVIMPRGLIFWGWLGLTLAAIGGLTYLFLKQVREARQKLEELEMPLTGPKFRGPVGLGLILLLGLTANLIVIFANPQPLKFDAWGYSDQGFDIAQQGYKADAIRTPGYPLFVAAVYKIVGGERPLRDPYFGLSDPPNRNLLALWIVQSLLLSLTAITVYALVHRLFSPKYRSQLEAKRYWGEPIPLIAAGLVAFCPFLWSYTGTPQTEICATFWLTLTVYLWVEALHFKRFFIYYWLAGLTLVWALETRPTFVYLPVLVVLVLAALNKGWWRILGPVALLVPLVLMLTPPLAANLRDWDEPTPLIAGDLSTYQTNLGIFYVIRGGMPRYQRITTPAGERAPQTDLDRLKDYVPIQQEQDKAKRHAESDFWKNYFANYVKNNPLEYAGTMLRRAWYQWSQHFVFPYYDPAYWDYRWLTDNLNRLYLILALFGLGLSLVNPRYRLTTLPLYLTILYLMGLNLLVQDEYRYSLPVYPLMLIFAAVGLFDLRFTPEGYPMGTIYDLRVEIAKRRNKDRPPITDKRPLKPRLIGLGAAFLVITVLSLAMPVIPSTSAAKEKALDAVYASQQQAEGCYYGSARQAIEQAVSLAPNEPDVIRRRTELPKELQSAITTFTNRINADPTGQKYDNFRCRGEAYRVWGDKAAARADFEQYLKLAPANARDRSKVQSWLKAL